jgi:D-glycero-alpha-D-manno-heptose-7-phosphate kinase
VVYSIVEAVKELSEIRHPAARVILEYMNIQEGLEIHHDGDLPARSGMGSSSAFTVGLLNTLYALKGQRISKRELGTLAIHIEQNLIKETVGSQDQIAVAMGGLNRIDFKTDDSFEVNPIVLRPERKKELESSLLLFFTGVSRYASKIAESKVANIEKSSSQLLHLKQMVVEAIQILQSPNTSINEFGDLLLESWKLKKSLSEDVSRPFIDEAFEAAMAAGARGGKILGAGGGGFLLFFVPEPAQAQVREKLSRLIEVRFRFENQGSRIALYDPELMSRSGEKISSDFYEPMPTSVLAVQRGDNGTYQQ